MTKPISLSAYLPGLFLLFFINYSSARDISKTAFNFNEVLQDTTAPIAYCLSGAITVPLPSSKCITIWAKDLDRGSFDNITPASALKFYFNGDRKKDSIKICCDDFVAACATSELIVDVQMWVEDEAGNADYCKVILVIQDNQDVCPSDPCWPFHQLIITIQNINGDDIDATTVLINDNNNSVLLSKTGSPYQFDLSTGNYSVCPSRDDDALNGISTLDVIKIRRHIVGIETLPNIYYQIAADVNRSNSLTASDVTEIRKLILGITTKFSKVPSWIFVPKDTMFSNQILPNVAYFKNYCKQFEIKPLSAATFKMDFIGIKMGDVNGSAKAHQLNNSETRIQNLILNYHNTDLNDDLARTDFTLNSNINLSGLQFTLAFNTNEFEFEKIENASIQIEDEQYSTHELDKGKINFAWDRNPLDRSIVKPGTLFSIIWKKKTSNEPMLSLDPQGINALIIDQDLNESKLSLQNSNQSIFSKLNVYQNFNDQTIQIEGKLDIESSVFCSLFDLTGSMIIQKTVFFDKGNLTAGISMGNLPANALYIFKVQSGKEMKIWKFLNFR